MHNEPTILAEHLMATRTKTHAEATLAGGLVARAARTDSVTILTDYTEHGGAVVAALEDIPGTRGSLAPLSAMRAHISLCLPPQSRTWQDSEQ